MTTSKPTKVILWHDNNIVLTIENCDVMLVEDDTNTILPYRWIELETGQQFAELDGWHYRMLIDGSWVTGWETVYEEDYFKDVENV
jgi:hypothetical protein